MGCASSSNTTVSPLKPEDLKGDEDGTASKHDGRGDSAVSKGTTDSGVGMDSRETPDVPGAMPRRLKADRLLQLERRQSSEILKELLTQGIIPLDLIGEKRGESGEAFSVMLDDSGMVKRPPARLESLKAKREQRLASFKEIEDRIKLAEERRQLKEAELKARLRNKSARVRVPAAAAVPPEDSPPFTPDPLESPPGRPEAAEGGGSAREAGGDGMEHGEVTGGPEKGGERVGEDGDGEEEGGEGKVSSQAEEPRGGPLPVSSGELELDPSFQHSDGKEGVF